LPLAALPIGAFVGPPRRDAVLSVGENPCWGAEFSAKLSLNSIVAIRRGLVPAHGELLIWGTLMLFTTGVAVALLANVRPERASAQRR
jgi:hypothetical protein